MQHLTHVSEEPGGLVGIWGTRKHLGNNKAVSCTARKLKGYRKDQKPRERNSTRGVQGVTKPTIGSQYGIRGSR